MRNSKSAGCAVAVITLAIAASEAHASCKQGFCVSGRDVGALHVVEFSTTLTNVHHFNVSSGQILDKQIELGRNETQFEMYLPKSRPATFGYAIQACAYGGFPPHSNCKPWVNFTHTVQ